MWSWKCTLATRPHALISKLSFDIHHSMHMCAEPKIDTSYMVLPSPFNRDPENVAPRVRFLRPPMWNHPSAPIPWLEQNEQKTEFSWESSAQIRALGPEFGDHEIKRSRCFGQKRPREKTKYIHALTYTYLHTHQQQEQEGGPSLSLFYAYVRVCIRWPSRLVRSF